MDDDALDAGGTGERTFFAKDHHLSLGCERERWPHGKKPANWPRKATPRAFDDDAFAHTYLCRQDDPRGADVSATQTRQALVQLRVEVPLALRRAVKIRVAEKEITVREFVQRAVERALTEDAETEN